MTILMNNNAKRQTLAERRDLSDYERQRLERIRRNEAKLRELGLLNRVHHKQKKKKKKKKQLVAEGEKNTASRKRSLRSASSRPKRMTRSSQQQQQQRRQSPRLAAAAVAPSEMEDVTEQEEDEEEEYVAPKRRRVRRQSMPLSLSSSSSSSSSLSLPKADLFPMDWLSDMRHFLWKQCGNSWTNVQRVMDKIELLAHGRGIRHPESKAYFYKNQKIAPWHNIQVLLDEGHEWVEENGGDRGHGWLVTHPLRKLWLYQESKQQQQQQQRHEEEQEEEEEEDEDEE